MSNQSMSEVLTTQKEPEREHRISTFKATQLAWLFFGTLEALIALRIGLKIIGANPDSPIAAFIYGITSFFLFPFKNLMGDLTAGAMVLETSSIISMVIYALLAWGTERLIWVLFYRPRRPVVRITQTTTSGPTQ